MSQTCMCKDASQVDVCVPMSTGMSHRLWPKLGNIYICTALLGSLHGSWDEPSLKHIAAQGFKLSVDSCFDGVAIFIDIGYCT